MGHDFFQLQSKNTTERNKELERRKIVELVGFLGTTSASEEEMVGRQSGSIAWRLIRGEAGTDSSEIDKTKAVSIISIILSFSPIICPSDIIVCIK